MEAFNIPAKFMETAAGSSDFPSNAEFVKDEAVIPWRDVECNTPCKVLQLDKVTTKWQQRYELQKLDNTVVNAWATEIIKENVRRICMS